MRSGATGMVGAFRRTVHVHFTPFISFPVVFTSTLAGRHVLGMLRRTHTICRGEAVGVPATHLGRRLLPLVRTCPPPTVGKGCVGVGCVARLPGARIPSFIFFTGLPRCVGRPCGQFLRGGVHRG